MKGAYYNEIDPYAAEWLRNAIVAQCAEEFIRATIDYQSFEAEMLA